MSDLTIIRVVDLETTGFPPDAEPIEIAAIDVRLRPFALPVIDDGQTAGTGLPVTLRQALVRPTRPIPPQASAVHHLIDEDVAGASPWGEVWPLFMGPAIAAFCAHSAAFERAFIGDQMTGGKPWVCTWKCALRLWPDALAHSNQALRYWLKPAGLDRGKAALSHRAWPDAYVTAHLLALMIERASIEELIAWSAEPALLARVPFGNWKGHPWQDVDDGFLSWVLSRDFDENVMHTARTEQKRRAAERGETPPMAGGQI